MIWKIVGFELKKRVFQWTTLLYFLILVFQGIWYTKGNFEYYTNDGLLMNATTVFFKNLAGGGILMIIIIAIITGTALYKDKQYHTAHWIYTLPVNEKQFFLGRFLSAYFYNIIIALGYLAGMLLVPYSGIGDPHCFAPTPFWQLLDGFFFLTMPNLLLLTTLIFTVVALTQKMALGYLVTLVTVIAFLLMQTAAETSGITNALAIGDPFGYVGVDAMANSISVDDKNFGFLKLRGSLLYNRILWFSITLITFLIGYLSFSFKRFVKTSTKSKKQNNPASPNLTVTQKLGSTTPSLAFGGIVFLKKLWSLARLEFKNIVRPVSFRVVLGVVLLMITLQNLIWNFSYYIGATQPLTSTMTLFRLTFGVFIMILLMVWAGELFFKDRTVNIHQITDTLPVPVWVTLLSRYIAMIGVAFVMAFSFVVIGIVIQVLKGGANNLDLWLYAYDLLGYNWGWLTYVCQISLVFFIAGLTGNRFLTHILGVGILFGTILAFELGLAEQTRFAFGAVPGLEDYSEMSGYGIWITAAKWYFLMWALLSAAFVFLGILFWDRGVPKKWYKKLSLRNEQLSWPGKIIALLLLGGFFVMQSFVADNTIGKNNFTPGEIEETERADYEKRYGYLKNGPQPKIFNLDATFDLFPMERKARYSARISMVNTSTSVIDTLFLNQLESVHLQNILLNNKKVKVVFEDNTHRLWGYRIQPPLSPNDTLVVSLSAEKRYQGFTQSGDEPQTDLTYNGSFGRIYDFIPSIGYDENKQLQKNRKRVEQQLPKIDSRMASTTDARALRENYFDDNALAVSGTITISTAKGQIPLAPGTLKKEWTENNRVFRSYRIAPSYLFDWHIASADYLETTFDTDNTTVGILSSPKHQFNIKLYKKAATDALKFVNNNLGNYPYNDLRIAEINYYNDRFYSYPNTIAISEKEGWYADTAALEDKAFVYHLAISQIIGHWITENIKISNVQGAQMLTIALPEALGLFVVEEQLGKEAVDKLLKKKQEYYAKEKNKESNIEPPLIYADGQEYLEGGKGVVAMNYLINIIGKEQFIATLKTWIVEDSLNSKVFKDFYDILLPEVPKESVKRVKIDFEDL
ncbi:ABC transporter permease [Maribacter sp. 2-571]|uniref:ABC transporter permease n=1 Tax=Maribacter sp. 2-571 TaxID=3417569 RepID=UPI003D34D904